MNDQSPAGDIVDGARRRLVSLRDELQARIQGLTDEIGVARLRIADADFWLQSLDAVGRAREEFLAKAPVMPPEQVGLVVVEDGKVASAEVIQTAPGLFGAPLNLTEDRQLNTLQFGVK